MSTVFHATPPPWYESVKDLAPGAKRRLGDGFLASFNGKAYHRYDFREKTSEVYEPQRTLAEKLAILAQQRVALDVAIQDHTLPEPAMEHPRDWPSAARVWLHKAHLNNDDIQELGAYWNPELLRVVIPYRTMTGEQTWTARNVGFQDAGPKYLNPIGGKRSGGALFEAARWPTRLLVLTEDILSAYRVMKDAETDALAVSGTSLDRSAVVEIVNRYHGAIVWLDGDEWGKKGGLKIRSEFSRLGFPVHRIKTTMDPKVYEGADLYKIVSDAAEATWQT